MINIYSSVDSTLLEALELKDPDAFPQSMKNWKMDALKKGFLEASVDTFFIKKEEYLAYVFLGKKYEWEKIKIEKIDSDTDFDTLLFEKYSNQLVDLSKFQDDWEELSYYFKEKGYPLLDMELYDVLIDSQKISAKVKIDLGKKIIIDSLINEQAKTIHPHFLYHYLGFKKGEIYDEKKVLNYEKSLRQLQFLNLQNTPFLKGNGVENTLYVNLKSNRASKFDFLLFVQPSPVNSSKYELNGEGILLLKNSFKHAEHIELSFKKITQASNNFKLYLEDPFLPFLPIGAELKFELQKRDSSFLDVQFLYGIRIALGGNNFLKIKNTLRNSILLQVNTASILNQRKLPANLDFSKNTIGLEFNYMTLNSFVNPTKGIHINISSNSGNKKIKINSAIASLSDQGYSFRSLYDSIDLNIFSIDLQTRIEKFFSLGKLSTLKLGYQNGWINNVNIFNNELYRIGGFKTMRGYNEESLFASWYQVATLEYRFLIAKSSYIFAFGDAGIYGKKLLKDGNWDKPLATGVGLSLDTQAGVVSFSYAIGKEEDNQWKFSNSKIHFGYITYF